MRASKGPPDASILDVEFKYMKVYQIWLKAHLSVLLKFVIQDTWFAGKDIWQRQDNDREHILRVCVCIHSELHNCFPTLKNLLCTLIAWAGFLRINKGVRRIALLCLIQTEKDHGCDLSLADRNHALFCSYPSVCFCYCLLQVYFSPLSLLALSHSALRPL